MSFCNFFEIFLTGIFSATGAFVPVFLVMLTHFVLRKNAYKKYKDDLLKLDDGQKAITEISRNALEAIYHSVGTEDLEGLMTNESIDRLKYSQLVRLANEHLAHIIKGTEKSNQILLDIGYIDSYNFGTYLGTLLDKRFPDKNFK